MILFPRARVALTILGMSLLGDWLRDALDPKLRFTEEIAVPTMFEKLNRHVVTEGPGGVGDRRAELRPPREDMLPSCAPTVPRPSSHVTVPNLLEHGRHGDLPQ